MIRVLTAICVCLCASALFGQEPAPHTYKVRIDAFELDSARLQAAAGDSSDELRQAAESVLAEFSDETPTERAPHSREQFELLVRRGALRELGKAQVAAVVGKPVDYAQGTEVLGYDANATDQQSAQWIGLRGGVEVSLSDNGYPTFALSSEVRFAADEERVNGKSVPMIAEWNSRTNLQLAAGQPTIFGRHSSKQTTTERRWFFWKHQRERNTRQFVVATLELANH
jgi:hypothetical protein